MFSVTVRDHMMVAHSLRGEVFGPAQQLHGATYVVDATFRAPSLDADGLVVDIGRASAALAAVVAELGYRNLDEDPTLAGSTRRPNGSRRSSPTGWPTASRRASWGPAQGTSQPSAVVLHESHIAWASYERAP